MFWTRPHAIIEATDALEELLVHSDLGDELPAGLIRPPFPACYIPFGKIFQNAIIRHQRAPERRIFGVYVFEVVYEGVRVLSFVPISDSPNEAMLGTAMINMPEIEENQSTNQYLQDAFYHNDPNSVQHCFSIMELCTKIFLYMSASQTVQLDDPSYTLRQISSKITAKKNWQNASGRSRIYMTVFCLARKYRRSMA